MKDARDIRAAWQEAKRHRRPCVLATIVATQGSTYRRPGARALITRPADEACAAGGQSLCVGLLSGGCLEPDLMERAAAVFSSGTPVHVVYDLRSPDEIVFGLGLGCEGRLDVWLERVGGSANETSAFLDGVPGDACALVWTGEHGDPHTLEGRVPIPWRVCVVGAGEDARPLCRLLDDLGIEVEISDRREGVCAAFARSLNLSVLPPPSLLTAGSLSAFDALVVMSHHFESDAAVLAAAVCCLGAKSTLRYVGCLGPTRRREKLFDLVPSARSFYPAIIRAPAGLALGGDSPEAIALSIAAELHAALHEASGVSFSLALTGQEDRIHDERIERR